MVFVIIAINFGGILAGALSVIYCVISSLMSIHYEPKEVVRFALAAFITMPFMPPLYSYFGNNLLFAMYSFTIISYSIYLLLTIFIMPGQIFDSLRYIFLAIPIAFMTNTLYVKVFGDPMLALFSETMELKLTLPFVIGAILIAITGLKIFGWYLKKLETKYAQKKKPV